MEPKCEKEEVPNNAETVHKSELQDRGKKNNKNWQGKGKVMTLLKKEISLIFNALNCKEYEHYQSQCKFKKMDSDHMHAKVAQSNFNESETLLMVCKSVEESQKNTCMLDTGCTNHMYGNKEIFSDHDESIKSEVTFGNSSKIPVKGRGRV